MVWYSKNVQGPILQEGGTQSNFLSDLICPTDKFVKLKCLLIKFQNGIICSTMNNLKILALLVQNN